MNLEIIRRGLMLVLSSPSGAGKTSICRKLLEQEKDLTLSVSATTRTRRPGEVEGADYQFISTPEFETRINKARMRLNETRLDKARMRLNEARLEKSAFGLMKRALIKRACGLMKRALIKRVCGLIKRA